MSAVMALPYHDRLGAEVPVLKELATTLWLDGEAFGQAYERFQGAATQAHTVQSRSLLARLGGHGFPTLALEHEDRFTVVDIRPFLGQPDAWRSWLTLQMGDAATPAAGGTPWVCGLDGCAPQKRRPS